MAPLDSSFSLMGLVAREDCAVCTVRDVRADFSDTTVILDRRSSSTKNGLSPAGGPLGGPLAAVVAFLAPGPFSLLLLLVLLTLLISECHPEVPPGRSIFGKRLSARGVFWVLDGILSVWNHMIVCLTPVQIRCYPKIKPNKTLQSLPNIKTKVFRVPQTHGMSVHPKNYNCFHPNLTSHLSVKFVISNKLWLIGIMIDREIHPIMLV